MLVRLKHLALAASLLSALLAAQSGVAQPTPSIGDAAAACKDLAQLRAPSTAGITDASWIAASNDAPWVSPAGFRGAVTVRTPFCRVQATIAPVEGSSIAFEVWLPPRAAWNERFFGTASGGSMGAVQFAALPMPLSRGFAAMGHDNGHASTNTFEQTWAFDSQRRRVDRERLTDFGSRAQHVSTVAAKTITSTYYGAAPRYSYYVACSQGGHHGMMEAQRFPEDYDGIVAGAHGGDWTGMVGGQAWAAFQVLRNDRAGALTPALAAAVSRRAITSCDELDGLADGLIEDPRACRFDPAVMLCGADGADGEQCLTPAQVESTRQIYQGVSGSRSRAPGFAPGSERYWGWTSELSPVSGSYFDFYRLLLHRNPDWSILSFNASRDVDAGRRTLGPMLSATNPDLSAFQERGGKLIMYHGWSDPLISPYLSVNAWDAVQERMGADATERFARLFMIPGMAHCGGGPIGGTREIHDAAWLTAIQNWVEHGAAPDGDTPQSTVIGQGAAGDQIRMRPYCPYPRVARYSGRGDINRAENHTCSPPPDRN